MSHIPSHLEQLWREIEEPVDQDAILAEISKAVDQERVAEIEKTISRRVLAMMKYLFGACNKERRAIVLEPIGAVVARNISEIADPEQICEEFATGETYHPDVSLALATMEETLHDEKDKTLPASKKVSLRELFAERENIMKKAA